jgi:sulfur carrier protein ThiS
MDSAGTIRVTLKLYATLGKYLLAEKQRSNQVELDVPASAVMTDLIAPFSVPPPACFLVLVNGVFLPPSQRSKATFVDGDVVAIWPPVAGG